MKNKKVLLDKLNFINYKLDLVLKLLGTQMGKETKEIIDDNITKYKEIKNVKSE